MKKRFVKDLVLYAPSQFLPALTAFITTPILTRLLAPTEYGYWARALSVSGFLVALAISGMGSAALRFYPAYEARATLNVFFATIAVSVGTVVTIGAGLCFLVLFLSKEILPSWLVHLLPPVVLIFVAQSIYTSFLAVIRAQKRSGLYTSFQLAMNYGSLGVGLLLVTALGLGVQGLLWGNFLALVATLPVLLFLATKGVWDSPTALSLSGCPSDVAVCMAIVAGELWPCGGCGYRTYSLSAHYGRPGTWASTRCPTTSPRRASTSWWRSL